MAIIGTHITVSSKFQGKVLERSEFCYCNIPSIPSTREEKCGLNKGRGGNVKNPSVSPGAGGRHAGDPAAEAPPRPWPSPLPAAQFLAAGPGLALLGSPARTTTYLSPYSVSASVLSQPRIPLFSGAFGSQKVKFSCEHTFPAFKKAKSKSESHVSRIYCYLNLGVSELYKTDFLKI